MTSRAVSHAAAAARTAAALLAGAGLLGLGACEQRPEPHPTYAEAPPPPEAPLAGEPQAAPTMAPPEVAPEPPAEAPSEPAPPPPSAAPTQGLVAMAPIPNPEDGGPVAPHAHRHGYGRAWRHPRPAYVRHAHAAAPRTSQPPVRHPASPPRTVAAAPTSVRHAARPPVHAAPPMKRAAPPPAAVQAPPKPAHERRATPGELSKAGATHKRHAANTTEANATANGTGASVDQRTEALRSALSGALAKGAVLNVPKASSEGASDVTLTVPADFYDTLQKEAGKQAMGDAAASVNLDATLSGDGWSIIPSGAQAQPLHAGQPTVFKWTVTSVRSATGVSAGPLRADVNADLLGGGSRTLALGAVDQQGGGGGASHWWGAALLALVVLLGLGFLLRGRAGSPPAPRRRPVQGEVRRPFDMNNGNGDYRP